MNKIKPSAISKQEIVTGTTEANRINIINFLKAAELYGVPAKYLFEVKICLKFSKLSHWDSLNIYKSPSQLTFK